MAIFTVIGVVIALSGSFACDTSVPLPKLEQPFDWSKYVGTWYMTITTFDPSSLNFACMVLDDVPSVVSERGDNVLDIYTNGLRKTMHWRLVDEKNGYFRHIDESPEEIAAIDFDENGNFNLESAKIEEETKHRLITYLGDYKHYLAHIECAPEGWIIEIFTDVKTISAELLLHIRNDLLQHGVAAPLRISSCADIDDI